MDVTVRTGSTKSPRDVSLASLSLQSMQGEQAWLVMEVEAAGREAQTVERECEAVVKHALLEAEGDAAVRLDSTLKELNGLLKGLLVSKSVSGAHMVLSILDASGVLHVSHAGQAEAYLIRKGVASQITEYSGKPAPAFVHISSGQLEARDIVVFSTARLLRTITPAQLSQMAQRDTFLEDLVRRLEGEGEYAALAATNVASGVVMEEEVPSTRMPSLRDRRARSMPRGGNAVLAIVMKYLPSSDAVNKSLKNIIASINGLFTSGSVSRAGDMLKDFIADLSHPKRKKRAHLLLLAGAVSVLLIIWVSVHLLSSTQRSKTRTELEKLVEEIGAELQTAENRRIIGDVKAANDLLAHADGQVKQIMDNDSGLFRVEALDLLDRIRAAEEKINNIARLSPRVVANLAGKNADIVAQGLLGVAAGEFIVYDRQDLFRLVLNSVEDPVRLSEEELIIDATAFPRFQSSVFLTTGNSVVEVTGDQRIAMKTEDPKGWAKGVDMESYLRFLYVLSPDDKQIYKYEHLNGRYSTPVAYNVNGDLTGALDMAIDGSVYVLKDGGKVVKLFRGEDQPFEVRRGPEGVLQHATRMFKVTEGNFYFLDPEERRVIVIGDSGQTGEAPYIKQYVLEGEQVGNLKDLYVDDEESILYVLDEKRVYAIELSSQ